MNAISEYQWQGHNIQVRTSASPLFLWLDYKFDVLIDNRKADDQIGRSLRHSDTRFTMHHEGRKLKGRVISQGIPGMPFVAMSTIIDDTIVGREHLFLLRRLVFVALLLALIFSL